MYWTLFFRTLAKKMVGLNLTASIYRQSALRTLPRISPLWSAAVPSQCTPLASSSLACYMFVFLSCYNPRFSNKLSYIWRNSLAILNDSLFFDLLLQSTNNHHLRFSKPKNEETSPSSIIDPLSRRTKNLLSPIFEPEDRSKNRLEDTGGKGGLLRECFFF